MHVNVNIKYIMCGVIDKICTSGAQPNGIVPINPRHALPRECLQLRNEIGVFPKMRYIPRPHLCAGLDF